MKKTKLVVDNEYEFDLLGLIASVKFYKLAWAINNKLHIRLVKVEDYILEIKDKKPSSFSHYLFEEGTNGLHVFKNKSIEGEPGYLVPEFPHFDYVLQIDSDSQSFVKEEIIKELKEVTWIEYIAGIEVEKLKSKDNFLT